MDQLQLQYIIRSQWSSDNMPDCSVRGPGLNFVMNGFALSLQ